MFRKKTICDADVEGKRVLVRVDFNVPLENGQVADDTRIKAALPTIGYLVTKGAKVILVSHLGRPNGIDDGLRLTPVGRALSKFLIQRVYKADSVVGEDAQAAVTRLRPGEVLLLENVRFHPGEKANDPEFAKRLASLADIYVNDAFGAAHRAHASTVGVTQYLPAYAGLLLEKEVRTLSRLLESPDRPFYAVLGGNKVSDKIGVIDRFLDMVDGLLAGGGMCYTFLKAKGLEIGKSLLDEEELDHCREMLAKAESAGKPLRLPTDVVIAEKIDAYAEHKTVPVEKIPADWMGLDIGPDTTRAYRDALAGASTIFWNGPMGVFELDAFALGTKGIVDTMAGSSATTIVGGGDTDAAMRKWDVEEQVAFVSTGGGASLKMLEGSPLPGLEALQDY